MRQSFWRLWPRLSSWDVTVCDCQVTDSSSGDSGPTGSDSVTWPAPGPYCSELWPRLRRHSGPANPFWCKSSGDSLDHSLLACPGRRCGGPGPHGCAGNCVCCTDNKDISVIVLVLGLCTWSPGQSQHRVGSKIFSKILSFKIFFLFSYFFSPIYPIFS